MVSDNDDTIASNKYRRRNIMADKRVPVMQRVLDNPFLLLFIGVVVPTVFYIIWGIMEIIHVPIAK